MDLFVPFEQGTHPAIVFIGNSEGPQKTDQLGREAARAASRGLVSAVIDYRPRGLSGKVPVEAVIEDIWMAARWLRSHSDEYGVDRSRIALIGTERASMAAALAGILGSSVGFLQDDDQVFGGMFGSVVLIDPVFDLNDRSTGDEFDELLREALGSSFQDARIRSLYSPIDFLRSRTKRDDTPLVPPLLIVHGTADKVVPLRQSEQLVREMRSRGFSAGIYADKGASRGSVASLRWNERLGNAIDAFLIRTLAKSTAHPGLYDSQPVWSPDGKWIAFESYFGGAFRLWLMRPDGSGVRPLGVDGNWPHWSPDSKRIAFSGTDHRLRIVNIDGSDETLVTDDSTEFVVGVRWHKDGDRILYLDLFPTPPVLKIVRLSDRSVTPVSWYKRGIGCMSWSLDGDELFHQIQLAGEQSDIYRTRLADGQVTRLSNSPTNEFCPALSPDGSLIAFHRRYGSLHARIDLFVMRPDGSGEINLTDNIGNDRYPSWSPDGKWIAFSSTRTGNYEIYKIRPDGTGLTRLTRR